MSYVYFFKYFYIQQKFQCNSTFIEYLLGANSCQVLGILLMVKVHLSRDFKTNAKDRYSVTKINSVYVGGQKQQKIINSSGFQNPDFLG